MHSAISSTLLSRLHCTDTGAVRQMPSRSWPRPRPCSSCGCPRAATTHWTRRRANEQSRMQRFWRLWVDLFAKARNLALGALRQAARFLHEASVFQSLAENESHQSRLLSHLRCASPLPRLLQRQHPMHGSLLYLAEHLSIPAVYQDECVVGCACSHQSPADSSRTPFISSKTMLSPSEDRHESARRRRNSARSSSSGEGSAARCARCASTAP